MISFYVINYMFSPSKFKQIKISLIPLRIIVDCNSDKFHWTLQFDVKFASAFEKYFK